MSVTPVRDSEIRNSPVQSKLKLGVYVDTLAGNLTIGASFPPLIVLDPGGAGRTITLPAEEAGLTFVLVNTADAAEDLTVQDDAAGAVGTVSQNEVALLVCDGTAWHALVGANT